MAVEGLAALRQRFKRLPEAVRLAVRAEMELIAQQMVAQMRRLAPRDQGELAASIGWTWGAAPDGAIAIASVGDGEMRITIYAGNDRTKVFNSRGVAFQNAKLQEFGTKAMPASPFFFPVVRAQRRGARSRITRAATKAARQIWPAG